jgi:demethylmenaquinone methyltransferase/2-methoxy-6-polyprenyl-1,4-benzoquinol methylase
MAETASSILATDVTQEVLTVAKAKTYLRPNVTFGLADCYSLHGIPSAFTAGFGGFIWSHIPVEKLPLFLDTVHSKLKQGGKIVFLDNRYVPGSSTPICQTDSRGNTYQQRWLEDGSPHLVLKNFPAEAQIMSLLDGKAVAIEFIQLQYYWYLLYKKA